MGYGIIWQIVEGPFRSKTTCKKPRERAVFRDRPIWGAKAETTQRGPHRSPWPVEREVKTRQIQREARDVSVRRSSSWRGGAPPSPGDVSHRRQKRGAVIQLLGGGGLVCVGLGIGVWWWGGLGGWVLWFVVQKTWVGLWLFFGFFLSLPGPGVRALQEAGASPKRETFCCG